MRPGAAGARVLALGLGILLVAAVECSLRLLGYSYAPRHEFQFFGYDPVNDARQHEEDPDLFWRLRPGSAVHEDSDLGEVINADGFRGPRLFPPAEGRVIRVIAIGDSSTYGVQTPYRGTYVGRTAALLAKAAGRPVSILNAGCHGYSSYQGLVLFRARLAALRPDAVTIYLGSWNDFTPAIGGSDARKGALLAGSPGAGRVTAALRGLRLYQAVAQAVALARPATSAAAVDERQREEYLSAFRAGTAPDGRRVSVEEFEQNIRAMIDLASEMGARVVVITPPLSRKTQEEFPIYRDYRLALERAAGAGRASVARAAEALEKAEESGAKPFRDWVHPSREGHERIAALVAEALARVLPPRRNAAAQPVDSGTAAHDAGGGANETRVDLLAATEPPQVRAPQADFVRRMTLVAGRVARPGLFMHPPSRALLPLPRSGRLVSLELGTAVVDGALAKGHGDGVTFTVALRADDGAEAVVDSWHVNPFASPGGSGWHDHVVPMEWSLAGAASQVALEADPGPAGDAAYDWGGWSPVSCRVRE